MKEMLINLHKQGRSQTSLCQEYSIPRSTLSDILRTEKKIEEFKESVLDTDRRKKVRLADNPQLDKSLIAWFSQERDKGNPITGDLILEKAKILYEKIHKGKLSCKSFNPTCGFLNRFKERHGIRVLTMKGEILSSDITSAENFLEVFHTKIKGYTAEQIFNCDETGLYWKAIPNKTMASVNEKNASGFKISKERVSILFCANASGSLKLLPLLIGKSQHPRILKNVEMKLPVVHKSNPSCWMTGTIFQEWFYHQFVPSVKEHLKKQNQPIKAILLLDNAPVHVKNLV